MKAAKGESARRGAWLGVATLGLLAFGLSIEGAPGPGKSGPRTPEMTAKPAFESSLEVFSASW